MDREHEWQPDCFDREIRWTASHDKTPRYFEQLLLRLLSSIALRLVSVGCFRALLLSSVIVSLPLTLAVPISVTVSAFTLVLMMAALIREIPVVYRASMLLALSSLLLLSLSVSGIYDKSISLVTHLGGRSASTYLGALSFCRQTSGLALWSRRAGQ